jgi:hypothetical protein
VSAAPASPVDERRDLRLRRLRDSVAARYGVPPAALAALDGSTVRKMAALLEQRILHFRIQRAGVPRSESDGPGAWSLHAESRRRPLTSPEPLPIHGGARESGDHEGDPDKGKGHSMATPGQRLLENGLDVELGERPSSRAARHEIGRASEVEREVQPQDDAESAITPPPRLARICRTRGRRIGPPTRES